MLELRNYKRIQKAGNKVFLVFLRSNKQVMRHSIRDILGSSDVSGRRLLVVGNDPPLQGSEEHRLKPVPRRENARI
jgi:hypothetical protein